ncbi:Eco57I restriction-modification methylase domain-containing protein [Anaerofustis sp. HA2171]|uniref:Eco57I restriction-modification methylase domain-containing protein n=1 Tax=Anaerofustis butyriciformans TaxID=3108533 RepID=UPI002E35A9BC|nr:N-6 DNA methylase [Anaerofustis sp. HA2171]
MLLKEECNLEKKYNGVYYTPLTIATCMVKFFKHDKYIKTVLEPSCGNGIFLKALVNEQLIEQYNKITAVEIQKSEAATLSKTFKNNSNISIYNEDFFEFYKKNKNKYDLILGNPPYIRYQYIAKKQQNNMIDVLTSNGMKSNKLINIWVAFIVACVNMLSNNGKIAFIIPSEILYNAYAEDLRLFLYEKLSKITLITCQERIFSDIEQEVLIFIGEKGDLRKKIRIIELNSLKELENINIDKDNFQTLNNGHEKWTKYFISKQENQLLTELKKDKRFQTLGETGIINVGITTGNNKYFSINKDIVDTYDLTNVVKPLIGKNAHTHSIYFNIDDWEKNVKKNKDAYLVDFSNIPFENYSLGQKKYIQQGERQGVNNRYKCKIREKWYQIPYIWIPDAFFLRKSYLYPKFILNCCKAVSTSTMNRVKFNNGIEPERIILSYYNSISFAFTEINGRCYGRGLLEILPKEAGNILVPILDCVPIDKIREVLYQVDTIIRNKENIEKALILVDKKILEDYLGINNEICYQVRYIWKKLQHKRLKKKKKKER